MEIHFYESLVDMQNHEFSKNRYYCWKETEEAIENKVFRIATVQMGLLSTRLIEKGYRIFIHPVKGKSYELRLGDCEGTDKEIRMAHNLFKMWEAGAFYVEDDD